MRQNWPSAFQRVLKSEGGYVNDPSDHGGETNLGVTRAAWGEYIGRPVRDGEMRKLTPAAVEPFYKSMYWDKVRGDELPIGVDYAVFDFAVNAGPDRAVKMLQQTVGVMADGVIGPATLAAARGRPPRDVLNGFSREKAAFYQRLANANASQQRFLRGWLNRVRDVDVAALDMVNQNLT